MWSDVYHYFTYYLVKNFCSDKVKISSDLAEFSRTFSDDRQLFAALDRAKQREAIWWDLNFSAFVVNFS